MNSKLLNSQIALFFKEKKENNEILNIYLTLNNELGNILGLPTSLPLPDGEEYDAVPSISANSEDNTWSLKIARNRVDLVWTPENYDSTYEESKDKFKIKFKTFYNAVLKNHLVKRIAFVNNFYIETNFKFESISSLVKDEFRKIFASDIVANSQITYASKSQPDELLMFVNDNFSATAASLKSDKRDIILILRDFNTIDDEDYSDQIVPELFDKFVGYAESKFILESIEENLSWPKKTKE